MDLTIEELKERLIMLDEVLLLELLDISSEDIVERFGDLIEEKQEQLRQALD